MRKIFFQRGPDGTFSEFARTGPNDPWTPLPGQDIQLQKALHGAGWYLVASVRAAYSGSDSHTAVTLELGGEATTVFAQHLEVYLEPKRVRPCDQCGRTALSIATFCYHCGAALPADGKPYAQHPVPPRPRR